MSTPVKPWGFQFPLSHSLWDSTNSCVALNPTVRHHLFNYSNNDDVLIIIRTWWWFVSEVGISFLHFIWALLLIVIAVIIVLNIIENNYIIIVINQSARAHHTHHSTIPSVSIATGSPPQAGGGGRGVWCWGEQRPAATQGGQDLNGLIELVELVFCCYAGLTGVLLFNWLNWRPAADVLVELVFHCWTGSTDVLLSYWFTAVQLCPAWLGELEEHTVPLV